MSRSLVYLWSFPVDGGGIGPHLMRGPRIPAFCYCVSAVLVELQTVGFGAGSTIDIETEGGAPVWTGITSSAPSGAAPDSWALADSINTTVHTPPEEYLQLVVNTAALTGGQLEAVLEVVEL